MSQKRISPRFDLFRGTQKSFMFAGKNDNRASENNETILSENGAQTDKNNREINMIINDAQDIL